MRPSRRFRQRTLCVVLAAVLLALALPEGERFDLAVGAKAEARLAAMTWHRGGHRLRLIDRADDAWATRIAMIRAARERIDLSTFIWRDDPSGREMFGELLAAARRGVRIRLLGDAVFFLRDPQRVANMAAAHELLELRLHNPVGDRLQSLGPASLDDWALDFLDINRRMHIKLLIVDGRQVLLGGRNVGDEYFGRHETINFVDREALVEGPVVADTQTCFDAFWHHADSRGPFTFADVDRDDAEEHAWPRATHARERIGEAWFEPRLLAFWWDHPEANGLARLYDPDVLANRFAALVGSARERVLIMSPYLILSERTRQLLERLRERHEDLVVTAVTNSLAATDDWKAYTGMFVQLRELLGDHRLRIYGHQPEAFGDLAGTTAGRSSLHAKTYVVDRRYAAIGSYNFDPRSGYWNTECLLVADDPDFADEIAERIERHTSPEASWVIAERRRPPVIAQGEAALAFLSRVVGDIFSLDLWPLVDHDYYEHVRGEPVDPYDPAFEQRYRAIGPFAGVPQSDSRAIKLRLFGNLGEAATPNL